MELALNGIDCGYIEGRLGGFRSSFLKEEQYAHMRGLNSLEELSAYLCSETDYGDYLDDGVITIASLRQALRKKLADEVDLIEANSSQRVAEFLYFVRAGPMLDNVMNIVEGLRAGVAFPKLLASVDPIGYFPELRQAEIGASDLASLYEYVLIDSPVGNFFGTFLESVNASRELRHFEEVQSFFKEERPEKVRGALRRELLERFNEHCQTLGNTSAEIMSRLLDMEADFRTIQVAYNSLEDNKEEREVIRNKLSPAMGQLYPLYQSSISQADSLESLRDSVRPFSQYRRILNEVAEQGSSGPSLEDLMYEEEVREFSLVFDQQANLASYYAYVRLKDQEIRNIIWYSEMIVRRLDKNHQGWKRIVVPFSNI